MASPYLVKPWNGQGLNNYMKIKLPGILVLILLTACHTTKSVMIRNETNQPITLIIPSGQQTIFFNDAIKKIYLDAAGKSRDTVLWYGHGQWTNTDKVDLDVLLHQSKIVMGKDTVSIKHIHITRYGLLIKELFVRIK
jgi:hypothetical protein